MKILVYDDNPDFGGHQIMACHGVEALASDPTVELVFMLNPANQKLAKNLPHAENLNVYDAPCTTRRFQGLRNRFANREIQALAKKFRSFNPDLILCIQGDIEHSSQAVIAARRAGIACTSYIAIPHRLATMGARFGALRDRFNKYLFNQPERYITISESMKETLIQRGVRKPIHIVANGIPIPPSITRIKPRDSQFTLGLIGRIEFKQKQQDFMINTFANHPEVFKDCALLIAGNGPDEEKVNQMISGSENITFLPWQEDPETFYRQIDCLILPSRYEGVPLVMLEALARGIPVIGSACDGMKDLLPKAWTFEAENSQALADTFSKARTNWRDHIAIIQKKVVLESSLKMFKDNFRCTLLNQI